VQVRRSLARQPRDRLGKGGVGEPFGIDQLSNDAMDEDLVGNRKAGRRAGADGLDHRNASLRKPFSYNASVGAGFMRAN
jgi:hypothetical protein